MNSANRRTIVLFLAPALAALLLVGGYPLANTFRLSLTSTSFYTEAAELTGWQNYRLLFLDAGWWRAMLNTAVFTLASVALEVILGVGTALILNLRFPGRRFFRVINLIPFVLPLTVVAQLWKWMYHDVFGVMNDLLMRTGLIGAPIAWLDNRLTAMAAIVAVGVWKFTPFVTLLALAGLQTIPRELYEAASIDGAGPAARLAAITLPLLKSSVLVATVFRVLDAVRVFDLIYVMTGNAASTISMAMYARQQMIDFGKFGYGSAASVVIFLLILGGTVLYLRLLKERLA
jgi:trehalose/maltose transport system permease protein